MTDHAQFLRQAVDLARANSQAGGRPFGALVVKAGAVIAQGVNDILATGDPTAHAELTAIRHAARALGTTDLAGCTVYASGQPCPMCLAAMRLARVDAVLFAFSNADGAPFGLSTESLYAEMALPFGAQNMDIAQHALPEPVGRHLYADWYADRQGRT